MELNINNLRRTFQKVCLSTSVETVGLNHLFRFFTWSDAGNDELKSKKMHNSSMFLQTVHCNFPTKQTKYHWNSVLNEFAIHELCGNFHPNRISFLESFTKFYACLIHRIEINMGIFLLLFTLWTRWDEEDDYLLYEKDAPRGTPIFLVICNVSGQPKYSISNGYHISTSKIIPSISLNLWVFA